MVLSLVQLTMYSPLEDIDIDVIRPSWVFQWDSIGLLISPEYRRRDPSMCPDMTCDPSWEIATALN